jgi:putative flippase GtrA
LSVAEESAQHAPATPGALPRLSEKPSRIIAQYVRFLIVGLSNAIVDLGVLNVLLYLWPTRDPLTLIAYNTVAVTLAILNSYLWNTRWTFHALATGSARERTLFVAQGALNVLLNNAVLLALTLLLRPAPDLGYFVASNLAKLCAMLTASSTSFTLLRTVVFRRR